MGVGRLLDSLETSANVTCICCFPFATLLFPPVRMAQVVVEEESKSALMYQFMSF